jgi:hypothetical protein
MLASRSGDTVGTKKKNGSKVSPTARASKGGLARKKALTPAERAAIAKKAAEERWATLRGIPKETHTGVLKLGAGLPCSVLENGKRVFSVMGLLRAFGSGGKSRATLENGTPVPEFLSAMNLQPFISAELKNKLENTIEFRSIHGGRALGYSADILNLICDALLDARAAGVLRPNQLKGAAAAEALMRAFSRVGVIALIDEATGYQADRASRARSCSASSRPTSSRTCAHGSDSFQSPSSDRFIEFTAGNTRPATRRVHAMSESSSTDMSTSGYRNRCSTDFES